MCRGLGKIENQILEVLNNKSGSHSLTGIYFNIMISEHKNPLKKNKNARAKYNSICRAVKSLKRKDYLSTRKLSRKEYNNLDEAKSEGLFFHQRYTQYGIKQPTWVLWVSQK